MSKVVFDASAVLALLRRENGEEIVRKYLHNSVISTVNLSEVLTVLVNIGMPHEEAENTLSDLIREVIPFDHQHASIAASLVKVTKPYGLSLGDRVCLALSKALKAPVLTADKMWNQLSGFKVILIR